MESIEDAHPCLDNLDCPLNEECVDARCQPMSVVRPLSVIDLELTPLRGQKAAPTQVPNKDLSAEPNLEEITLQMAPAISLSGFINSPFGPGGIPGTLTISRSPEIDSRRLSWTVAVADDGSFAADLSPSRTSGSKSPFPYSLVFKPKNREEFPQLSLTDWLVEEAAEPAKIMSLNFPGFPEEKDLHNQPVLLLVRGKVLFSPGSTESIAGVKVEGIVDTGLRSNLVTPDETGVFFLRLPVQKQCEKDGTISDRFPETLDVIIKPDSPESLLPTVTFSALEIDSPDLGTFFIGELPKSHTVSGTVTGPGNVPLPDCQLRFQTKKLGNGVFSRQSMTDLDGRFSTTLPGGSYQVTVVPPILSDASLNTISMEISKDQNGLTIPLPPRVVLSGTVLDPQGNPAPEVTVHAERVSSVNGRDDTESRTYEGITDNNGEFQLQVDGGHHHLTFIPSAASRLPRTSTEIYFPPDKERLVIQLPEPAVIRGHVFDGFGQPICNVTMEIFRSDEKKAALIGQTISGGVTRENCTGAFAAVIPGGFLKAN